MGGGGERGGLPAYYLRHHLYDKELIASSSPVMALYWSISIMYFLWLLILLFFVCILPPWKRCEILPQTHFKEFRTPSRPPKTADPALFTAQAGSDLIHPLTQLALQPVEWRNAATSSLCDIPHTIMHGPSSTSHGSLHTNFKHMGFRGWKWEKV